MVEMINGDEEMAREDLSAYALGYNDGIASQPRDPLCFSEAHDTALYSRGLAMGRADKRLCQGCYANPCECLPDDCNCDPN